MKFSIVQRTSVVRQKISMLPMEHRVCFAAWCLQTLLERCTEYLSGKLAPEDFQTITSAVEEVWQVVLRTTAHPDRLQRLHAACDALDWAEDSANDAALLNNVIATEMHSSLMRTLATALSGSAEDAAFAAEHVINALDYEIGEDVGENATARVFADPRMQAELKRQDKMIQHLKRDHSPPLQPADRDRRF